MKPYIFTADANWFAMVTFLLDPPVGVKIYREFAEKQPIKSVTKIKGKAY